MVRMLATDGAVYGSEIIFRPVPGLPGGVFLSGQGDGPVDVSPAAVVGGQGEFEALPVFWDLRKTIILALQVGNPGLEVGFGVA